MESCFILMKGINMDYIPALSEEYYEEVAVKDIRNR